MFAQLSRREKIIILLGILIIISSVYYFYIYQPKKQQITQLEREINTAREEIPVLMHIPEELPKLKEELTETEKKTKISQPTKDPKSAAELMNIFFELSDKNNIDLTNFRPQTQENSIELNITYTGEFSRILSLYKDFNDLDYDFQFQRFSLQPAENELRGELTVLVPRGEDNE
ncbi:MAG: hypothetical protein ACOC4G_14305 [Bacillota bacterium]